MKPIPVQFSYAGHYKKEQPVPMHSHRGVELVYVASGACVTEFSGRGALPAGPGTVYVTPAQLPHAQRNPSGECETFYAVMEISGGELNTELRTIDVSGDPLLAAWFRNLYELNRDYAPEEASFLLMAIWSRLLAAEEKRKFRQKRHPALLRAMDDMEEHSAETVSISEIARRNGISQSHLNALFRRETGAGAEEYRTALRMKQARRLLLNRYYSIGEVGAMTGYPDPNYFSRKFRLYHGVSPRTYREAPFLHADHGGTSPASGRNGGGKPKRTGTAVTRSCDGTDT